MNLTLVVHVAHFKAHKLTHSTSVTTMYPLDQCHHDVIGRMLLLVASLLLVAMPGAPSSVLAPSSDARSPY